MLSFIKSHIEEFALPPSVAEIADHMKITSNGAYDHLNALERKGWIRRTKPNTARAIKVLE